MSNTPQVVVVQVQDGDPGLSTTLFTVGSEPGIVVVEGPTPFTTTIFPVESGTVTAFITVPGPSVSSTDAIFTPGFPGPSDSDSPSTAAPDSATTVNTSTRLGPVSTIPISSIASGVSQGPPTSIPITIFTPAPSPTGLTSQRSASSSAPQTTFPSIQSASSTPAAASAQPIPVIAIFGAILAFFLLLALCIAGAILIHRRRNRPPRSRYQDRDPSRSGGRPARVVKEDSEAGIVGVIPDSGRLSLRPEPWIPDGWYGYGYGNEKDPARWEAHLNPNSDSHSPKIVMADEQGPSVRRYSSGSETSHGESLPEYVSIQNSITNPR